MGEEGGGGEGTAGGGKTGGERARTEERRVRARDEGLAHEGLQEGVVRGDHLVEVGGAVERSLQRVPRALEHL